MTGQPPNLAPIPTNPFIWHESVLSTRSLSYMSTVSALGTNPLPSPLTSRHPSNAHMFPRAMDQESEYDLEMAPTRESRETLPDSVAHSLLFDLPREIRDRIYSYCLISTERPAIEWPASPPVSLNTWPQLLQTCKVIFSEAAQVLYSNNTLVFSHPSDANVFVRAICSRLYTGLISNIEFQMRAQDTRLWAPYLTSQNQSRSLRYDFPSLRELTLLYKSNKWHQHAPLANNVRSWSDDRALRETIESLRNMYLPNLKYSSRSRSQDLLQGYMQALSTTSEAGADVDMPEMPHGSQVQDYALTREERGPLLKVVCMLKTPLADFANLTSTVGIGPSWHEGLAAQQPLPPFQGLLIGPPPQVHIDGEETRTFPQFDTSDFRARARRVERKSLYGATNAVAARTRFLDLDGVMFALELYAHLPEK